MVDWVCSAGLDEVETLSSDTVYKLFSAAMTKERRVEVAKLLGRHGGPRVRSIGLACSAARQVEDVAEALMELGAR